MPRQTTKLHPDLQRTRDEAKATGLLVALIVGGTFFLWGASVALSWAWRAFTQ